MCVHKCNLQRINATFAENKCNFLALLLQQKLALVITIRHGPVRKLKKNIYYILDDIHFSYLVYEPYMFVPEPFRANKSFIACEETRIVIESIPQELIL